MRVLISLLLVVCALSVSACGGGSGSLRDASRNGGTVTVTSDADFAGSPCVMRCVASCDIEISSWSWGVNNGRLLSQDDSTGEAWIAIDEPGACIVSARGVDKDGRDCTGPRHTIKSNKRFNAPPEPLPAGPIDGGFGEMSDNDGTAPYRYHEWRWNTGRSYDAEGDPYSTAFTILLEADLDGDGVLDELGKGMGDGSVRTADLDGDGRPDLVVMQSKDDEFVVRCLHRTIKSKEDVYVWKMAIKEQGITARKKEFRGHVTLMK